MGDSLEVLFYSETAGILDADGNDRGLIDTLLKVHRAKYIHLIDWKHTKLYMVWLNLV
jgi:hypothetical protein